MRTAKAPHFNVSRRENIHLPLDAGDAPMALTLSAGAVNQT
jgi:hypothetical protein